MSKQARRTGAWVVAKRLGAWMNELFETYGCVCRGIYGTDYEEH
jgi:hypothetical protein